MGTPLTKRRRRGLRRNQLLLIIIVTVLLLLGLILFLTLRKNKPAGKDPATPDTSDTVVPTVTLSLPQSFVDSNTASAHIVLCDLTTGKTLYSKKADEQCFPASMTKLLTAAVAVKYAPADTVFTVGDEIHMIDSQSSTAYLRVGNRLDMQTILEAMLLPSGNDAAYTVAANVGRILAKNDSLSAKDAIAVFCKQMNTTAAELGATHSHFANPDGIHNANHYTTAADMALIARHAYAQPLINTVVKEEKVTRAFLSGETGATWYNTNYLLRTDTRYFYDHATGMKTGHTDEAGYCLTAAAENGGVKLLAVLLGSKTSEGRFDDATGLFTVCFDSLPAK